MWYHLSFTRNAFIRPTIQLPQTSLNRSIRLCQTYFCPKWTINRRFSFSGYILSGVRCQLTGGPCPHGIGEVTQIVPLTKSHKSSFAFNLRRAWWDNHKSSHTSWHIPRTGDYNLRWQRRRLSALLTVAILHQKGHNGFTTLWATIMTTMGPTSSTETPPLIHIKTLRQFSKKG